MSGERKPRDFSYLLDLVPKTVKPYRPEEEEEAKEKRGDDDSKDDVDPELARQRQEEEAMRQMMGFGSFGRQGESAEEKQRKQDEMLAKAKRSSATAAEASEETKPSVKTEDDDDDDDDEEEGDDDAAATAAGNEAEESEGVLGVPISHEVTLKHGSKPIVTFTLDPSGSRLITGSLDYEMRFWDFNSMDVRLQSFRRVTPHDGYPIRCLRYSNTGDCLIAATGSPLTKLYDRDGSEMYESLRGDQYIYDKRRTHAHVAAVNCAWWHPRNRSLYITGSHDGTVRMWDMDDLGKKSMHTGVCRNRGKHVPVLSVHMNREGTMILAGCGDGTVHTFHSSEKAVRARDFAQSHARDSEVTCVRFATNGRKFISRSTDGTAKLWDVYRMSKPELVADDLPCFYNSTECVFSPDERFVLTGTSGEGNSTAGMLVILKADTFERAYQVGVGPRGVISVLWHLKINQIVVGCTDGRIKVFFDPRKSDKGAKLCATRAPREEDPLDRLFMSDAVMAAKAGVAWGEDVRTLRRTAKSRKDKERKDPLKSKKPEEPVKSDRGVGKGGRLMGYTSSLSQYIASRTAYDPTRDEDPREAILRHAEAAEKEPYYIARAYAKTQPEPVYDMAEHPEEEEPKKKKKKNMKPFS
ncbi:hypothetical protein PTSG_01486 [Salpingoeca rosetta]|uniref:Uncharacterized protein n=1 Tax=Salpingoeca rosetta (strain ATCC 50818 / BSB-021) TaxID=946362 RepID=F2U0H1_SALR5|nr:uncharacterized protein PTSG_01486 [Salpingoeca rosetta]EGD80899.1 hypothetical protein PTSG_01486 [Salpingoeca rosetta]|eukprot:XP_004997460.1 hypothetical protein PTSG_01486 [Salpingoeca rosetta]